MTLALAEVERSLNGATEKLSMGRHIFINGNLVATTGNLYTRDISAGGSWHPDDAEVVTPERGTLEITEDTGSIFDSYYVSGEVAAFGIVVGDIKAYCDIYKFTVEQYENGLALIKNMLETVPAEECGRLYLQQQYASLFSLMEQFLSCSFVKQTCDREDSYHKVIASGLLQKKFGQFKQILNGADCLQKELLYIELANRVVYHNLKAVKGLFQEAFGVNVDLSPLDNELKIRNDIMHRFGHTESGEDITVTVDDINALIAKIDCVVQQTERQISALPESERMYPKDF